MRCRELFRDLVAGVSTADDEHVPRRHFVRPAVAGGVHLEDVGGEPFGELRDEGALERTGRDNDLVRRDGPVLELETEAPIFTELELLGLAVELDRELERLGVTLEVGDHLVAGWVFVGSPGNATPESAL